MEASPASSYASLSSHFDTVAMSDYGEDDYDDYYDDMGGGDWLYVEDAWDEAVGSRDHLQSAQRPSLPPSDIVSELRLI